MDGELKRVAHEALTARPNFAYTLKVCLFVCVWGGAGGGSEGEGWGCGRVEHDGVGWGPLRTEPRVARGALRPPTPHRPHLFPSARSILTAPHRRPATSPRLTSPDQEVESDLRRVFATGWFSSCVPDAEDTRDGVKLIVKVGGHLGQQLACLVEGSTGVCR